MLRGLIFYKSSHVLSQRAEKGVAKLAMTQREALCVFFSALLLTKKLPMFPRLPALAWILKSVKQQWCHYCWRPLLAEIMKISSTKALSFLEHTFPKSSNTNFVLCIWKCKMLGSLSLFSALLDRKHLGICFPLTKTYLFKFSWQILLG